MTFFFGGGKEAFDEARLEINLDFIASCVPNHEFEQMVIWYEMPYPWVSKWMNKWMNGWMNEWMNEWMNVCMNERKIEWMNQWTNEQTK